MLLSELVSTLTKFLLTEGDGYIEAYAHLNRDRETTDVQVFVNPEKDLGKVRELKLTKEQV